MRILMSKKNGKAKSLGEKTLLQTHVISNFHRK